LQWLGTLLFVSKTLGISSWWVSTEDPAVSERLFLGVTVVPAIVAACTFIIAGWLRVVEASHSWLGGFHPTRIGWWAAVINTLGGIFFLVDAVLWYRVQASQATTIALLVGALAFFASSAIAWLEQCFD